MEQLDWSALEELGLVRILLLSTCVAVAGLIVVNLYRIVMRTLARAFGLIRR